MDLKKLRVEIDKQDRQLLQVLSRRFAVTKKVGMYKFKNNLPVKDLKREGEMFAKRKKMAKKYGLNEKMAIKIYRAILEAVYEDHKRFRKN